MNQTAPQNINEYIAAFSPEVQRILQRIRRTIHRVAPDARETISYGIPAFTLDRPFVYFAAFKKHIGLYPPDHRRCKTSEGDRALCRREGQSQVSA